MAVLLGEEYGFVLATLVLLEFQEIVFFETLDPLVVGKFKSGVLNFATKNFFASANMSHRPLASFSRDAFKVD